MSTPTAVRNLQGVGRKSRHVIADAVALAGRGVPVSGTEFYVDAANGSDSGDGDSWDAALLTMGEAFDRIGSGDVIYLRGKVTEQLDTPVQVFDVSIVGVANIPRHADSTPSGGESGSTWAPPGSPDSETPLLTVRQQGWTVANILFDAPSDAAAVRLFRDGGSGNDERDGSHFSAYGCKFLGGDSGLEDHGGVGRIWAVDCDFEDLDDGVKWTVGAGIGQPAFRSVLRGCRFRSNADSDVVLATQETLIEECVFDGQATINIDLSDGGGNNVVTRNTLGGTYGNPQYEHGSNDVWFGNFGSGGVTDGLPA